MHFDGHIRFVCVLSGEAFNIFCIYCYTYGLHICHQYSQSDSLRTIVHDHIDMFMSDPS